MGITNVNNTNKAQIVKLALNNKNKQVKNNTPEYMKMTGSIFNAPEAKSNDKRQEIANLNTEQSLKTLTPKKSSKPKVDGDSFQDVDDASSGRAAISTGKGVVRATESYTAQTEKDEKVVNQYSKEATRLTKDINDNDKKFGKALQADQKAFDKDNQKIQKTVKESEETQKEIDDAKHELDGLLAANSFKMGGEQNSSDNSAKINELQTFIGSKIGMLQKNGKTIYSLQRSQTRTLTRMKRTNRVYVNTQKTNQKNIKSQENSTNSVIDTAQKIEQYSALAQAGGQALGLAGDGLVALGHAMSSTLFGSSVGAVLISIGEVMQHVGSIMELVGQYGQAAANITKTAAYAAEGNLMGAMQSAVMAAQTGAAAVKSTTQMGKTWNSINEQARAAKQNIAAQEAAKETVNKAVEDKALTNAGMDISNMTKEQRQEALKGISKDKMKEAQNEALGGMTTKQAKQFITSDLREQMAQGNLGNTKSVKELKQKLKEGFTSTTKDSDGHIHKFENWNAESSLNLAISSYNHEKEEVAIKNKILDPKFNTKNEWMYRDVNMYNGTNEVVSDLNNKIDGNHYMTIDGKKIKISKFNKIVDAQFKSYTEDVFDKVPNTKIDWGSNLQKLGGSVMSIATVFMNNQAMNEMSAARKRPLPQYQMDARTRRIMQRNQMYANRFSYV